MNPRLPIPAQQMVSLDDVRSRLTRLWMIGGGAPFLLLVVQSLSHVYDPSVNKVWSWFLPNILPSMGIMVSALAYTALDPLTTGTMVRKSFVSLATWLSIAYLFLVSLTILAQPFAATAVEDRIALMNQSNLWLGPMQGLVSSAIGALFVTKEKKKD